MFLHKFPLYKRIRSGCLLGILLIIAGCSGEGQPLAGAPKVNYLVAWQEEVTLTKELPGRISAFMVSDVRPQVGGIIKERLFEEGTVVEAGQVLYQIDPVLYEAAYNNAKAELARVQANAGAAQKLANRYSQLVATGAISKQEFDDAFASAGQASAQVASAKEALETARINLGYTKVTAPVTGTIGRSFFTPGALVTQNQASPLATVQQLDYVYVDITQSSTELLKLQRARAEGLLKSSGPNSTKVKLLLEDGSAYALPKADGKTEYIEGDLLFSDVTIDQSTGAVALRAKFKNENNILLPGMYVRAVIEEGVRENAILIPQKTIKRDPRGRTQAYVLSKENPNKEAPPAETEEAEEKVKPLAANEYYVVPRSIAVDRDYENHWIVTDGLREGEMLVAEGLQKIRPGQVVATGAEVKSQLVQSRQQEKNKAKLAMELEKSPKVSEKPVSTHSGLSGINLGTNFGTNFGVNLNKALASALPHSFNGELSELEALAKVLGGRLDATLENPSNGISSGVASSVASGASSGVASGVSFGASFGSATVVPTGASAGASAGVAAGTLLGALKGRGPETLNTVDSADIVNIANSVDTVDSADFNFAL